MKKPIKFTALLVAALMIFAFCGCAQKNAGTASKPAENGKASNAAKSFFEGVNVSDYVELGEYKGVTVDTSSDAFLAKTVSKMNADIKNYGLAADEVTSRFDTGKVQMGDTANIDYEGKKDGVAFQGGTAQGHDLIIGSNSFISGFESGLVGVSVGETVDLNLKFPEVYHSADLAGQAVVFTVKVNYIKRPDPGKIYAKLGFKSAQEYNDNLKARAANEFAVAAALENGKITGDVSGFEDAYFEADCARMDALLNKNNLTLESVLNYKGMTLADYRNQISAEIEEEVRTSFICYAILEKEGISAEYDLPAGEKTGIAVIDELASIRHVASDFIYKNAVIK